MNECLVENLFDGSGCICRVLGTWNRRQQNGELIAPEAGHRVAVTHAAGQTLGHRLQHAVAGCVTERIVNLLEAIEIQQQDGLHLIASSRERDGLLESIFEEALVGQISKRIMIRKMIQSLLGLLVMAEINYK